MDKYYKKINEIIEDLESKNFVRFGQEANEKVESYWQIGKMLVEAQGGSEKAKDLLKSMAKTIVLQV